MEAPFKLQAVEYDGTGEEEEVGEEMTGEEAVEESADEDIESEEEEEEEEEDDLKFDPASREHKIQYGASAHYCPVTLRTRGILAPGSADFQCKYRERLYKFVSDEARQQFMHAPERYLPTARTPFLDVPPLRVLFMGPRGAGKNLAFLSLKQQLKRKKVCV